jgi:Mn2+/Fe2+ NRAMP family transporter
MKQLCNRPAPKGLALLAMVGPSFIWCAEYIGSGEVILATRTGAILGTSVLWAIFVGIFFKYWIGLSGARYTVCTGEGMIDMFDRLPGPRHWAVWIILVAQLFSAMISIGSIATAAGIFINSLIPISPYFGGWFVTVFALAVVWSGVFDVLKVLMSLVVLVILIGVFYVAGTVFPGWQELIAGLGLTIPNVPDWATQWGGVHSNPWREILPLIGWAAGGFASQVWYTYWVIGAGYGAAEHRGFGKPADVNLLSNMTRVCAEKIKSWCHVVYADATLAMVIGNVATMGFLIAGAGILGPNQLAPEGPQVATALSTLFSSQWGEIGGTLFMISAAVALVGTQIGQLAGWPRLLADAVRLCIPSFNKKFSWKTQFRLFLVLFFITNMTLVYSMGLKPVFLVKAGAILDGLLLTPLQALAVGLGLYVVMPRLLSKEAWSVLKPHWIFGVGLGIAFIIFGYFCVFQVPYIF